MTAGRGLVAAGLLVFLALVVGGVLLVRGGGSSSSENPPGGPTFVTSVEVVGERTLRVVHTGSACQESDHLVVEESPDRVVVTPWAEVGLGLCPALAVPYPQEAVLDAPLGDRLVVDGGCLRRGGSDAECRENPVPVR